MFTAPADAPTFETPNATMHTLASPSLGSAELAVWRVEMAPGAAGPVHSADRDQAWVVLGGSLEATVDGAPHPVEAGGTLVLPAHAERQVRSADGFVALVSSGVPTAVSTAGEDSRPLPWAD